MRPRSRGAAEAKERSKLLKKDGQETCELEVPIIPFSVANLLQSVRLTVNHSYESWYAG